MVSLFKKNNRAFSAIEILIVVAIIGILISIVVINFIKIKDDIKKKSCIANMGTIHNAVRMYYMENPVVTDNFDLSLKALLAAGYLKTEPRCPNADGQGTNESFYAVEDVPGKKIDIKCVNKDPKLSHGSYLKLTNQDQKPSTPKPKP